MHVPGRPGAVDQHHRALLDPLGGRAGFLVGHGVVGHAFLDGHGPAFQGNVPELADVAEHQHVRVEVDRLARVARQFGDGETGEGEVGARALTDVARLGQAQVNQGADLHLTLGVPANRMLQHRDRQELRPIGSDIGPHQVVHPALQE